MGREIKFRAWNKISKKFYVWQEQYDDFEEETSIVLKSKDNCYFELGKAVLSNVLVLQQFTDFKDKNGKEIYEGDILGSFDKRKKRTLIVKYDSHFCEEYGDIIGFEFDTDLEVIGNIYENPELKEDCI